MSITAIQLLDFRYYHTITTVLKHKKSVNETYFQIYGRQLYKQNSKQISTILFLIKKNLKKKKTVIIMEILKKKGKEKKELFRDYAIILNFL